MRLDPSRIWWEDLRIVNRRLPIFVTSRKWTITTLICEDLARNDPARGIVETIGPNLVISLLLDGPQIPERWSAKYASVLAEDPGSSVLSISSIGLIDRSNKTFVQRSSGAYKPKKSFALWRDDTGSSTTIELEEGSHAVAISLSEYPVDDFTVDGRKNNRPSISLRLTGMRQIRDTSRDSYPPWEPD